MSAHDVLQAILLVLIVGSILALCFRRIRQVKVLRWTAISILAVTVVFTVLVIAYSLPGAGSHAHRCTTQQSCTAHN